MDLLYGHNEAVAAWVAAHIPGCEPGFVNPTAIGVIKDERLIGGTVFTNFDRKAKIIEMSSAGTDPRWLNPRMLRAIFSYPFDQLGCQLVVMRVAENNKRMVRIAQKFGFTGYLIPRLCGRDEGQWVFTLTDDAWRQHRFARSHHGH